MARVTADKLVSLGMAPELAKEVVKLITPAAVTALVSLTDSSGGAPSNTIVDVPAAYTEATLANQLSSLTAKVNQIITALKA